MKTGKLITTLGVFLLSVNTMAQDFTLSSEAISEGETLSSAQVFNGFGCTGENISPDLSWTAGPEGTKSYAIMVHDPDAPTGSGWWHWTVYNIPVEVTSMAAGAGTAGGADLPDGAAHGRSDYGFDGFGGACPPQGDDPHRYVFTVFALGVKSIEVPEGASTALIGFMVNANALGKAQITATYGR